jgi:DNA processing protein
MVLGCGHGIEYPKGCTSLRDDVSRAGAVISELPNDAKPKPLNFPRRNRIVAALSEAVVVIQAGAKSGALVTAKLARGLGTPVLAAPGLPNSALTRGTHGLLREGAALVESATDILTVIGVEPMRVGARESSSTTPRLEGLQEAVVKWLDSGPASPDELARELKRPVSDVLATLVELEMEGLVSAHGGCYERQVS